MRCEGREVLLDRIGVQEEVRRLHEEELLVVGEVADRLAQEIAAPARGRRRTRRSARRSECCEAVVEVAGLGVHVARARQVVARRAAAQSALQLRAGGAGRRARRAGRAVDLLVGAAVVEQPDGQLVGRARMLADVSCRARYQQCRHCRDICRCSSARGRRESGRCRTLRSVMRRCGWGGR